MAVDASHPLLFMHIPKTAGMSMFRSLCHAYGTKVADMYNISATNPAPAAELVKDATLYAYCGHYSFGLHEWLDRPSYYIGMVRHPVDRVISLFLYVTEYRRRYHAQAKNQQKPVRELVLHEDRPDFFHDFLQWIDGKNSLKNFLGCPSAELDNGMVRRFSGFGLNPNGCPEEALDRAKRNIERYFTVVGVQEEYGKTLELLRDTFGWEWIQEHRINTNHDRSEFSSQARDYIARMNPFDLELYDWVVERFERQLAAPPTPLMVPAGGRTDFENMVLWRAVGASPGRLKSMKEGGVALASMSQAASGVA